MYTDDEIDGMFAPWEEVEDEVAAMAPPAVAMPPAAAAAPLGTFEGLPLYPLAQVPPVPAPAQTGTTFFTQKVGPLPVWAWALGLAGTAAGGYFFWTQTRKVSANAGESKDDEASHGHALPADTESSGWRPSRTEFAGQLNRYFTRKGLSSKVHIYPDADEASGKLKQVSPLVNVKWDGYKADKDLEKLCKREGLNIIAHEGSIGFYPAASGKKAKAWEEYIDLLRDDGQKI
jgi:hypothetical protein